MNFMCTARYEHVLLGMNRHYWYELARQPRERCVRMPRLHAAGDVVQMIVLA